MNNPVRLVSLSGLIRDTDLLGRLAEWMNKRYAELVHSGPHYYVGKRVKFKRPSVFPANHPSAPFSGRTGKVTDAYFCLDNEDDLFCYEVAMDFNGDTASRVSSRDFAASSLKDDQVRAAKEVYGPKLHFIDPTTSERRSVPVTTWNIGFQEVKANTHSEAWPACSVTSTWRDTPYKSNLGRAVRVIKSPTRPDLFLKEGRIQEVFTSKYHVRLNCGNIYEFKPDEVAFL